LIDRNTTIPTKKSQIFTTADDSQTSVDIHILQGERTMAKDNVDLGKFTLTGIPPARRGQPQIEVTFDIDSNGILHVMAKDTKTGKSQGMDIVAPNKMSKDDIEKKMEDAKKYEEQDKTLRDQIETKNGAESLVYTVDSTLDEYKDKVPKEVVEKINDAKKALQEALKGEDYDAIKEKSEDLKKALEEIGANIYKGEGGPGADGMKGEGAGGSSGSSGYGTPDDSSATDADFKVEK
jgi:molecular chaperone DnaK